MPTVAEKSLVRGKRVGVDASTMEANAALRTIVRREDGRTYREMLTQMARESGIETPSVQRTDAKHRRSQPRHLILYRGSCGVGLFNPVRRHSALGYRPPAPEAIVPRSGTVLPWASAPAIEGARSPNHTVVSQTRIH